MDDVMLMAYNHRDKVDMNNCVNKPEPLQIQNSEEDEVRYHYFTYTRNNDMY